MFHGDATPPSRFRGNDATRASRLQIQVATWCHSRCEICGLGAGIRTMVGIAAAVSIQKSWGLLVDKILAGDRRRKPARGRSFPRSRAQARFLRCR